MIRAGIVVMWSTLAAANAVYARAAMVPMISGSLAVLCTACAIAAAAGLRTWRGWLNFFVLQWFGARLVSWRFACCADPGCESPIWYWRVAWPVLPLSGWWTRYVGALP